jgi:cyclase
MLKKRIGAAVLIKDDWVVQSIGFRKYLPIGKPQIAVEFLNKWGVDEIFLIDISAAKQGTAISLEVVRESSKYCRVPLAAGGGITTVQQMENLLHSGADKISLNQVLLANRSLLTQGARMFGDQCMVGVIDFVQNKGTGSYEVYDYVGKQSTRKDVIEYAKELQDAGAGEILLQSVERDGMYIGFEIELYKKVCNCVSIPVVALGGAGNVSHFKDVLQNTDISAACAGNIFHFTEHSVNILKAQLIKNHKPIRLETGASYRQSHFDDHGRLLKESDQYLEDLLFIRIEKEVI